MNDIVKTIRVGTVDFFGVIVPGILVIAMCGLGFFAPMMTLVTHYFGVTFTLESVTSNALIIASISLVVFAYVLGYILRLSSPDDLDRISARNIITQERRRIGGGKWYSKQLAQAPWLHSLLEKVFPAMIKRERLEIEGFIEKDGWPFNPYNVLDKYPYLNLQAYLNKRGHTHLTENLVTWKATGDAMARRSKSTINMMKMSVRLHCPELNGMIESKEGHIRMMAGAWTAFRFSMHAIGISFLLLAVVVFLPLNWFSSLQANRQDYFVYMFIDLCLWFVMYFSNRRIRKLFHYRRVSELFHIVQAAYFAQQAQEERKTTR